MDVVQAFAPDLDWVTAWLAAEGLAVGGPVSATRIGHGYSNLTFRLSDAAGRSWVLRRPPPGVLLVSAHDVVREARIMSALAGTDVPVPAVISVRTDAGGVPWVLIEHIPGDVLDSAPAGRAAGEAVGASVGPSMVRALARIHDVDVDDIGLGGLASRSPYAQRQLKRWTRQWEQVRTGPFEALERLGDRLTAAVPVDQETALVHGDFHIRNVILRGGHVAAVLDWELSTLGDPLADLGTLLAYWPHKGETAGGAATSPTALDGWAARDDLAGEYAAVTQRDLSALGFWHVLGLWKVAVIGQGVLRRAADEPQAASLRPTPTVEELTMLVEYGHRIADEGGL